MRRWFQYACLGCVTLGCLVLPACDSPERRDPPTLPGVAPELAAVLRDPASETFAAFLQDASTDRLISLRQPLIAALYAQPAPSRAEGVRVAAILAGVDRTLADHRGLSNYRNDTVALAALPDTAARRCVALREEAAKVFAADDLAVPAKVDRLAAIRDELRSRGDEHGALPIWYRLAVLEHRRGDVQAMLAFQRTCLAEARRLGCLATECQSWGQLLMARMDKEWTDADHDSLEALRTRAATAKLADRTAYLMTLAAYHAARRGQYFTARTTFEDAIDVCRQFGHPAAALSPMTILLRVYASLECWDQVGILLERSYGLLAENSSDSESAARNRLTRIQLDSLAARRFAAIGQLEAAQAAFQRVQVAAARLPYEELSYVGRQWFEAMLDGNRPDLAAEALAIIVTGLGSIDRPFITRCQPFWQAWLDWRSGDLAAAEANLQRFRTEALATPPFVATDLVFPALALSARVRWASDRAAAADTLLAGWRRLQASRASFDAGPEAYLDLHRNQHLRRAAHDLLAGDADLGYGLELLWRDAMFGRTRALDGLASLANGARERAAAACARLREGHAMHCVYSVRPDSVVRWTADGGGVTRTTLPAATDSLRCRVRRLLADLAADPGDPDATVPARLSGDLAALAGILLPMPRLRTEARPEVLYITGDGFLAQLPFAPLNMATGPDYAPLIDAVDVGWIRLGPGAARPDRGGRSVVVGDVRLTAATRRRFALADSLLGARREMQAAAEVLAGAEVLTGETATPERVREVWETADVLYFVGHAITDSQVPFVTWLPLYGADPGVPYPGLGIEDVLAGDFHGCEAVFLSGCATGLPFVDGLSTAPSLGDAFLDAGARATVQTFWLVRDLQAPLEPTRVLAGWWTAKEDLVTAMATEQRRALRGPRGVRHPFGWAAWSVAIRGS